MTVSRRALDNPAQIPLFDQDPPPSVPLPTPQTIPRLLNAEAAKANIMCPDRTAPNIAELMNWHEAIGGWYKLRNFDANKANGVAFLGSEWRFLLGSDDPGKAQGH